MSRHETHDAYLRYRTGLTISLVVVLVQAIVLGFSTRSIALFEDTAHGIADNLVLIGATIVLYFEAHGATPNRGRRRILALIGGALLVLAGVWGGYTAYLRIIGIQIPISGWVLACTSLIAVIGGGLAFWVIHGVHKNMHDHLHKSAVGHLIGDLAISVSVFFSSVGIIFLGLSAIDSWVGAPIALWMIARGVQILRYKDPPESRSEPHQHDGHHH